MSVRPASNGTSSAAVPEILRLRMEKGERERTEGRRAGLEVRLYDGSEASLRGTRGLDAPGGSSRTPRCARGLSTFPKGQPCSRSTWLRTADAVPPGQFTRVRCKGRPPGMEIGVGYVRERHRPGQPRVTGAHAGSDACQGGGPGRPNRRPATRRPCSRPACRRVVCTKCSDVINASWWLVLTRDCALALCYRALSRAKGNAAISGCPSTACRTLSCTTARPWSDTGGSTCAASNRSLLSGRTDTAANGGHLCIEYRALALQDFCVVDWWPTYLGAQAPTQSEQRAVSVHQNRA